MDDTKSISDTALHFIKSHPLMDTAVPMSNKQNEEDEVKPVFYKRDAVFSKLIVDKVDFGGKFFLIIFIGTSTVYISNSLRGLIL